MTIISTPEANLLNPVMAVIYAMAQKAKVVSFRMLTFRTC
jgi:hypothetical protein